MNRTAIALIAIVGSAPAVADDLAGASQLLCAPRIVSHCSSGGDCDSGPPELYNFPDFIQVDLVRELLYTTAASGENLSTTVQHVSRVDGTIYLQGVEGGRAYSMVIVEATGDLAMTVASEGETGVTFGTCTPD